MLPSLDNLRCFVAAAEHGTFRRAAKAVALTPTAFGQRIRQLEDQVGAELFERTTRRVDITPAGEALLPVAREALRAARRCLEVTDEVSDRVVPLTLGTRFELGMSWLVPAVLDARRERPRWRLELYFGSGGDIVEQLALGAVDTVITSAPVARTGWHQEPLHAERYVFVGAPRLLARTPFDGADAAVAHCLLDVDHTRPLSRYLVSVAPSIRFRDTLACGAGAAVRALCLEGLGVAVLPAYMVAADIERGALVRLLPDLEMLSDTFRLLWREGHADAATLVELAAWLRARALT